MPVILKVWSSNPFNNGGCDFAIVELTQELANVALRRMFGSRVVQCLA